MPTAVLTAFECYLRSVHIVNAKRKRRINLNRPTGFQTRTLCYGILSLPKQMLGKRIVYIGNRLVAELLRREKSVSWGEMRNLQVRTQTLFKIFHCVLHNDIFTSKAHSKRLEHAKKCAASGQQEYSRCYQYILKSSALPFNFFQDIRTSYSIWHSALGYV